MMNITVIGGGSWGTTLAQVLTDNGHTCLIYDINASFVDAINNTHIHPFFTDVVLPESISATLDLENAVNFSDYLLLAVPTKVMREVVLRGINKLLTSPKVFINVSKGIEPGTLKRISEIVEEEIDPKYLKGFVVLTGPSHAEEVILRKLTVLVSASKDHELAKEVQLLFSNDKYLRVYTSNDLIGCELGGAIKNAIAVVSGISTGLGLGENARAALISRGVLEIVAIVEALGGKKETAFGLTGIGDLIVTASSENSRNFRAGKKIGLGENVLDVVNNSTQTVEGVRTIVAANQIAEQYNLTLPIIQTAYQVLFNGLEAKEAVYKLLSRALKME